MCLYLCVCVCVSAHLDAKKAGDLSTLFDVGGIVGRCFCSHFSFILLLSLILCVSLFFTHSLQSVFTFVHSVCVCCTGGILAGVISDKLGKRATTCAIMLLLAAPTVSSISDTLFWRDLKSEHVLDQDVQNNT